jgi:hypothetical protein
MPSKQNTTNKTALRIKAKRATVTPKRLRQRMEAGEDITGQRAIVRMGTMNTRILTGQEDLSTWEDEELKRGCRRNKNGIFQGISPTIVPKVLHDELVRRTLARSEELMRENLYDAIQALVDIIKGADTEDKDRIKAIEIIMNRVMGKEPMKVEVAAMKSRFEEAFEAMLVPEEDDQVIDADSWESEEDVE